MGFPSTVLPSDGNWKMDQNVQQTVYPQTFYGNGSKWFRFKRESYSMQVQHGSTIIFGLSCPDSCPAHDLFSQRLIARDASLAPCL